MKKIILILLLIVPLLCFGQGKVTRPKKQSNTVEQKSVPPKKQQSRENKYKQKSAHTPLKSTPIVRQNTNEPVSELANLSIAVEYQGVKYYYSKSEWNKVKDKSKFKKLGIVIKVISSPTFILSLNDLSSYPGNWQQAMNLGKLPTYAQAVSIVNHLSSINAALVHFGGATLRQDYWTSSQGDGGKNMKKYFHLVPRNSYTAEISQDSQLWARSVMNVY